MLAVDVGQARGQRAVHEHGDRPDLVHREELLEAVDHPLGPPQAERRDHHLALQPDGPRDDRVELLDQPVVRVELAIAVGALRDEDVDVLDRRRVGQEMRVPPAQVAGEDESTLPAILPVIELDDRRAQDVPGVEVGQGDPRHHLDRRPVRHAVEPLDQPFDVGQLEERFDRIQLRILHVGVAHFLALDPCAVAQHHAGDIARGRGGEDRPVISRPDQDREATDVVVVGVGDDHRVQFAGIERHLAVRTLGMDSFRIEQPAIEQNPFGTDLQ